MHNKILLEIMFDSAAMLLLIPAFSRAFVSYAKL